MTGSRVTRHCRKAKTADCASAFALRPTGDSSLKSALRAEASPSANLAGRRYRGNRTPAMRFSGRRFFRGCPDTQTRAGGRTVRRRNRLPSRLDGQDRGEPAAASAGRLKLVTGTQGPSQQGGKGSFVKSKFTGSTTVASSRTMRLIRGRGIYCICTCRF